MKDIEAIIPPVNVRSTIEQLRKLGVQEITVEPIKVYRSDVHRVMTYRGCAYEQNYTSESRLRFHIADQDATRAEILLASATGQTDANGR